MDPVTLGALAAAGVLCIAAGSYRIGFRRGHARGAATTDQWRDMAVSLMNAKADNAETLKAIADAYQKDAAVWQRRAAAMGQMLRCLGYSVQEVEDPAAGAVAYQATMVQPAISLPLGPSLS